MRRKTVGLRNWLPRHVCLVGGLLLAAAGALATVSEPLRDQLLASYYEGRLNAADNDETRELLRRLIALGRPGMAAAVRALGAPRPTTRELAYRALIEELNRYELQFLQGAAPPLGIAQAAADARLGDMARPLAEVARAAVGAERPRLESLAMRIVLLSETVPLADRGIVIGCCQQVLAARRVKSRPARSMSQAPPRLAPKRKARVAGATPRAHEKPSAQLELARFSPPPLVRADAQTPAEPGLLTTSAAVALSERPEKARPVEQRKQVLAAAFTRDDGDSQTTDEARKAVREQSRKLDVIELFNQLHAGQPRADAARMELEARGFSPRQIEVGQHLVAPDAAERLQWTDWLPGIRGVDARFWLLWLSRDPNSHVRRAAVGLLATDRDPEVVRRLQRVVVEDPDERIRVQASRALETLGEP